MQCLIVNANHGGIMTYAHEKLDNETLRQMIICHEKFVASMSGGKRLSLKIVDFRNLKLPNRKLRQCELVGADFENVDLTGI